MNENENKASKSNSQNNLMQLMAFTADRAMEMADANSIIGEKIEVDGMTIIPISKVSSGFAGGGASIINSTQKKSNVPSGSGAKVTVTPLSLIVVRFGEVSVIDISAPAKAPKKNLIDSIIEQAKAYIENKKKEKAEKAGTANQ
jgi:uncharacterized spore protein YtfJ